MSNKPIWLSPPHMSGHEQNYIQEAFDSNWLAPLGPNVDEFEKEIAQFLAIEHVAALSSGTSAIHLALVLLGVQPGDEVLVSTLTFVATVNPIVYLGATPVFIDSERSSWNMDPELLRAAIVDRIHRNKLPKAIIVVDLYGMPANMERITEIANEYGIPVIEDAAEALGSSFRGKHCGSFGHLGVLSFNGNKIITTTGGGALLSHDKAMIQKAKFLSTQARNPGPHYEHCTIGYNYRLSNVLAGIGRGQMHVLEERIQSRRSINQNYRRLFATSPSIQFQTEPSADYFSNYWLTAMFIDDKNGVQLRDHLLQKLWVDQIDCRPLWMPMHLQPIFQSMPAYLSGVSENLFNNGLCLPSGSNLTLEDQERIVAVMKSGM